MNHIKHYGFALIIEFMSTTKHAIAKYQLGSCLDTQSVPELAVDKTKTVKIYNGYLNKVYTD